MKLFETIFWPITMPIKFIQQNFKAVILVLIIITVTLNLNKTKIKKPNLAIIKLNGVIIDANEIVKKINSLKKNKDIKGVLFEINSPGGAVAPSIEISYAIKELNKIKPVIVYANGMLTSGGYYSAIWAKKIVTNPGSIIGSIGVILESADISQLLHKIGIKPQIAKAGKFKEVGTPVRTWSKEEKEEVQKLINDTYDMFVKDVANARKLDLNDKNKFANAHIFSPIEAKKVGLIDYIGTKSFAKNLLKKETKIEKAIWKEEKNKKDLLEKIITKNISKISNNFNGLLSIFNYNY